MTPTTPTTKAFSASYRIGAASEELRAWPARNGGVVVQVNEAFEAERRDALTILSDANAARLLAWLSRWFNDLPLSKRAELADHMPAGVVDDHDRAFLRIVAASERNRREFPGIGFEPVSVSVTELPH